MRLFAFAVQLVIGLLLTSWFFIHFGIMLFWLFLIALLLGCAAFGSAPQKVKKARKTDEMD